MIKIFTDLNENTINKFMSIHPNGKIGTVENCLYYEYVEDGIIKPIKSYLCNDDMRIVMLDSSKAFNDMENLDDLGKLKKMKDGNFFDEHLHILNIIVLELHFFENFIAIKDYDNNIYYLSNKNNVVYKNPNLTETFLNYNSEELKLAEKYLNHVPVLFFNKNSNRTTENNNEIFPHYNKIHEVRVLEEDSRIYTNNCGYNFHIDRTERCILYDAIEHFSHSIRGYERVIPIYLELEEIKPTFNINILSNKLMFL